MTHKCHKNQPRQRNSLALALLKLVWTKLNNTEDSVYTCTAVALSITSLASVEILLSCENLAKHSDIHR